MLTPEQIWKNTSMIPAFKKENTSSKNSRPVDFSDIKSRI